MMFYKSIFVIVFLSLSIISFAHEDDDDFRPHEIKALKRAGKISSLDHILDKLSPYGVTRLLEVELIENKDHPENSEYLYQIEYINHHGMVLELEVDALTSQVLHIEDDSDETHHRDDD